MKNPFNDFKLVDGVQMWRCECNLCAQEFYSKNPYAVRCKDKERHADIVRRRREATSWAALGRPDARCFSTSGDGSWDNAVSATES